MLAAGWHLAWPAPMLVAAAGSATMAAVRAASEASFKDVFISVLQSGCRIWYRDAWSPAIEMHPCPKDSRQQKLNFWRTPSPLRRPAAPRAGAHPTLDPCPGRFDAVAAETFGPFRQAAGTAAGFKDNPADRRRPLLADVCRQVYARYARGFNVSSTPR